MCLVAVAVHQHAEFPLIVAGNRDEFHARPSAAAHWWENKPVLGGRDEQAGGSWLAVDQTGRWAVITNRPEKAAPTGSAPSRGGLVLDFLLSTQSPAQFASDLNSRQANYAGFALAFGDPGTCCLVAEPESGETGADRNSGVLIVTNAPAGARWPKADFLARETRRLLLSPSMDPHDLLDLLARRAPVGDEHAGLSTLARSLFVDQGEYGTRASTLFTIDQHGEATFTERRYARGGRPDGESRFRFQVVNPG